MVEKQRKVNKRVWRNKRVWWKNKGNLIREYGGKNEGFGRREYDGIQITEYRIQILYRLPKSVNV